MGSSFMITVWCFLLSSIALALATNPTLGLLGAGLLLVLLVAFMFFIAPLRYCGTMLLHEEVVHVLRNREEATLPRQLLRQQLPLRLSPSKALTPPPAFASALPQRWRRLLTPSHAGPSEWPGVGADFLLGLPSRSLASAPRLRRRLAQV